MTLPSHFPRGDCSSRRLSPRGPFELSASESELVAVEQRVRVKCAPDAVAKRFQRALGVGIRTGNGFQNQKRSTAFDDFGGTEQGKFFKAFQVQVRDRDSGRARDDSVNVARNVAFLTISGAFLGRHRRFSRRSSLQCHSDLSAHRIIGSSQWIRREMRVACRGAWVFVAEKCADHRQAKTIAYSHRCK